MSQWCEVLNAEQLEARYTLTASLDPAFARDQRAFYESRTVNELKALITGAWRANDADGFQMARSHLALKGE